MFTDEEIAELVRDAYADERSAVSYDEVMARAARGPGRARLGDTFRRWLVDGARMSDRWGGPAGGPSTDDPAARPRWLRSVPVLSGLAVVLVLAGLGLAITLVGRASNNSGGGTGDAFATACAQRWNEAKVGHQAQPGEVLPPLRFAFGGPTGAGYRIYSGATVTFGCMRTSEEKVESTVLRYTSPPWTKDVPADRMGYLAVLRTGRGPELYFGAMPPGADSKTALTLIGGDPKVAQSLQASVKDGYFAVWSPAGGLDGGEVLAFRNGQEIASGPPTVLFGDVTGADLTAACIPPTVRALTPIMGEQAAAQVAEAPRFVLDGGAANARVALYASGGTMLACTDLSGEQADSPTDIPVVTACCVLRGAPSSTLMFTTGGGDYGRFIVGRAPARAAEIEIELRDGSTVQAQLSAGYYGALWTGRNQDGSGAADVESVTAYDAQGQPFAAAEP